MSALAESPRAISGRLKRAFMMTEAFYGEVLRKGRARRRLPDSPKRRSLVKHFLEGSGAGSRFSVYSAIVIVFLPLAMGEGRGEGLSEKVNKVFILSYPTLSWEGSVAKNPGTAAAVIGS